MYHSNSSCFQVESILKKSASENAIITGNTIAADLFGFIVYDDCVDKRIVVHERKWMNSA